MRTIQFKSPEDFVRHLTVSVPTGSNKRKAQAIFWGPSAKGGGGLIYIVVQTKIGGDVFEFHTTDNKVAEVLLTGARRVGFPVYETTQMEG
jgi:hypothetical protein